MAVLSFCCLAALLHAEDQIQCTGLPANIDRLLRAIPPLRQRDLVVVTIAYAEKAIRKGNPPFGAVLVDPLGTQKWWAHNTVHSAMNPWGHAEFNLLRGAGLYHLQTMFPGYGLITNAEPCGMCAYAAIKSGIRFFIYGAAAEEHTDPRLTLKDVVAASRHESEIVIIEGILAQEVLTQIQRGRDVVTPPKHPLGQH